MNEPALIPLGALRAFYADAELDRMLSPEQFEAGIVDLQLGAMRLSLEVLDAEHRGVPLHRAVREETRSPLLFQIHHAVRDLLTLQLPAEYRRWFLLLIKKDAGDLPCFESLLQHLTGAITDAAAPPAVRALARILLFELLRLTLLVDTHARPDRWRSKSRGRSIG